MSNASMTEEKQKKETAPPADTSFGAAAHERPVPRISIEAFSEFPDTIAALQRAAGDRRLSKAHIGVQTGGIAAAAEYFGTHATPNLLIVETPEHGQVTTPSPQPVRSPRSGCRPYPCPVTRRWLLLTAMAAVA